MDFFTELMIYVGISFLLIIVSFTYLINRRKNHERIYKDNWEALKWAIEIKDIEKINRLGDMLLWNDGMEKEDYIFLREQLELLTSEHTELDKLKQGVDELFEKKGWLAQYD